ncbi:hydantoinase/oxoprolinase family protein [Aquibium sp. A9E412]|uniref:hydantoinase/oxoprolinase family protein n=1 Tax=Aquibium sp. A9E412 TaxID=2976767 RepID=UPI0025B017D1|nr:hydantoinase/oxoprolinase family protein [Aquibium sp. A9E412]MDN2566921.1 hydantoinase/oxoprolinase family protein [Aquibium sp. A9E412]
MTDTEHPAAGTDARRTLTVAIDVGGTFTDVTLVDRESGESWKAKTATTPPDFERGFMDGIRKVLAAAGRRPQEIAQVAHGTTVATNAILEMRGAPAALLTTRGFRHVLEIGRHDIPRKANIYSWVKPKRPVSAHNVHEIPERLAVDGSELEPLDEAAVRQAAETIKARGIEAVAICFLHSFADGAHERRAREIVEEVHPDAMVSISSEVLPVFREFERSMATILNVYVMPLVATYVAKLNAELTKAGIDAPLLLMKSSGGVTGAATIKREPIQTALSGPAAGIVGAVHEADAAGLKDVITVDIGGTSADICLIKDGRPGVTTKSQIGDWPMTLPMVDIHTIGAGGGSIARVNSAGTLSVGPESAGARPGPVSYGRGGTEPTVTDAHFVLGHLPERLLAGEMEIDLAGARRAIEDKVARPLGISVHAAARGILEVVNNNMLGAIRVVSVERGLDPRDFALLPFGGAGPIHGSDLARLLGIRTVIVPPSAGVLSAIGLSVSSLRNEFARTCLQGTDDFDHKTVRTGFAELEAEAERWLAAEGVPESGRAIEWEAAMRYRHQGFELNVAWSERAVNEAALTRLVDSFHRLHEQLYSFAQEDTPVEIVTLRVTATGRLPVPARAALTGGGPAADAVIAHQDIFVGDGMRSSPVYDRARLAVGEVVEGPAILQQLDTTTLLAEGDRATVHPSGSLLIETG